MENSSQNAKNVVLLLLGEPEKPEGVLGRGELGAVVDAVDQRVLALGQVEELETNEEAELKQERLEEQMSFQFLSQLLVVLFNSVGKHLTFSKQGTSNATFLSYQGQHGCKVK